MYNIKSLGKFDLEKSFVFTTGKHLIVTNVKRLTVSNVEKIVHELIRMKISKSEVADLNMKSLQMELKNMGNLEDYVRMDFKKITNEEDKKDIRHYTDINTKSFGGGYAMKEIRIILI